MDRMDQSESLHPEAPGEGCVEVWGREGCVEVWGRGLTQDLTGYHQILPALLGATPALTQLLRSFGS